MLGLAVDVDDAEPMSIALLWTKPVSSVSEFESLSDKGHKPEEVDLLSLTRGVISWLVSVNIVSDG